MALAFDRHTQHSCQHQCVMLTNTLHWLTSHIRPKYDGHVRLTWGGHLTTAQLSYFIYITCFIQVLTNVYLVIYPGIFHMFILFHSLETKLVSPKFRCLVLSLPCNAPTYHYKPCPSPDITSPYSLTTHFVPICTCVIKTLAVFDATIKEAICS